MFSAATACLLAGVDRVSRCPECTWCKGADRSCFGEGLSSPAVSSSRAAVRQQLQDSSPFTGTVQQLSAALTQGLEETEGGDLKRTH